MVETYYCKSCGKAIFTASNIVKETNLWDLKDYQAKAFIIKELIEPQSFRRYDCSLHLGWYCCRFIAMRMVVDKFGTGNALLVYCDSVDTKKPTKTISSVQVHLDENDFAAVTSVKDNKLKVVKLGAIWCPPCRLMDSVIEKLVNEKLLSQIEFFELDIDKNQKIANKFDVNSIPQFAFFFNGIHLQLKSSSLEINGFDVVGGFTKVEFERLCSSVLTSAKEGNLVVEI